MSDMGPSSISDRVGPRRTVTMPFDGRKFDIFADGGLLAIEDHADGEYVALTVAEAIERFKQLGILHKKADLAGTDDTFFKAMRDAWKPLILALYETIKDARSMGDPTANMVVERKERAELRAELTRPMTVNPEGRNPQLVDPVAASGGRAYYDKAGRLKLKHGAGTPMPGRRHF